MQPSRPKSGLAVAAIVLACTTIGFVGMRSAMLRPRQRAGGAALAGTVATPAASRGAAPARSTPLPTAAPTVPPTAPPTTTAPTSPRGDEPRTALLIIGRVFEMSEYGMGAQEFGARVFGGNRRFVVDVVGADKVDVFTCLDGELGAEYAALATRNNLTITKSLAVPASHQFDRLAGCYEQVSAYDTQHKRQYKWFVRTRIDFEMLGPIPPLSSLSAAVHAKVRSAFNLKGLNDDHYSFGWGDSKKVRTSNGRLGTCTGCAQAKCSNCVQLDDQFALVPAEFARVYFTSNQEMKAFIERPVYPDECVTKMGGMETHLTRWLLSHKVPVKVLAFKGGISKHLVFYYQVRAVARPRASYCARPVHCQCVRVLGNCTFTTHRIIVMYNIPAPVAAHGHGCVFAAFGPGQAFFENWAEYQKDGSLESRLEKATPFEHPACGEANKMIHYRDFHQLVKKD